MKISTNKTLSNGMTLSIVEVDNPIAIEHFNHRFQIILEINGKKIMPKSKNRYLEFEINNYIYKLKSDKTNQTLEVNELLFYELQICDNSLSDCQLEIDGICQHKSINDIVNVLHQYYEF